MSYLMSRCRNCGMIAARAKIELQTLEYGYRKRIAALEDMVKSAKEIITNDQSAIDKFHQDFYLYFGPMED